MRKRCSRSHATVAESPGGRVRLRVRYACTSACAGALLLGSMASRAQVSPPSTLNRTVNLNYVYAAELGFGGYSLSGLTAQVYTLPLDYTLHDVLRDGWALRILAPIQLSSGVIVKMLCLLYAGITPVPTGWSGCKRKTGQAVHPGS